MDRLRPDQLRAERPDRCARAAADQQRDPEPGEPGHHADQPGEEPGEPALFLAGAARAVDHADPAASACRRSASPTASARSIRRSPRPIRRPIPARRPSQQLLADAQTRWQNALAGFQDAMHVQAGVVQNLDSTRIADQRAGLLEPVGHRRASGRAIRQPARRRCRPSSSPISPRVIASHGARAEPRSGAQRSKAQAQAQAADCSNFLNYGAGYQPGSAQMFH